MIMKIDSENEHEKNENQNVNDNLSNIDTEAIRTVLVLYFFL